MSDHGTLGLDKINILHIDRNMIKNFSKSVVYINSRETKYMVCVELVGRKKMSFEFKSEKDMQRCFNQLNNTTKDQVKAKLKRIK